jgi:hypothetical protein
MYSKYLTKYNYYRWHPSFCAHGRYHSMPEQCNGNYNLPNHLSISRVKAIVCPIVEAISTANSIM